MVIHRIALMNGRPLASALWILRQLGYPETGFGALIGATDAGGKPTSERAIAETLSWVEDHGLDWAGDFPQITASTPGVAERPAMQKAVGDLEESLQHWLDEVWPEMAVTEPEAAVLVPWLLKHSRSRHSDEQILVIPTTGTTAHRVEASTHVISRGLLQDGEAFKRWARKRDKEPTQSIHDLVREP